MCRQTALQQMFLFSSYCLCIGEAGGQLGLQDLLLCPLHELVAAVTAPHVNLTGFWHHGGLASLNAIWTDTGARVVWCHPTYLEEKDGRDLFTLFGIITCVWCYFYKKTDYRSLNYFYSLSSQGNNYIFSGRRLWGNSFHLGDRLFFNISFLTWYFILVIWVTCVTVLLQDLKE